MSKIAATNYVQFVLFCIVVLITNLITGCAINDFGLVDVKHFDNKTVHMVNLKAYGFFLSTHEVDAGLTFGFTERWYFYPKDKNIKDVVLSDILILAIEDHLIEQEKGQTSVDYSNKSIAWVNDTKGLIFNTNSHKIGFSLGRVKSQVIKLHRDFDGIFIFKYISDGDINAFYKQ